MSRRLILCDRSLSSPLGVLGPKTAIVEGEKTRRLLFLASSNTFSMPVRADKQQVWDHHERIRQGEDTPVVLSFIAV